MWYFFVNVIIFTLMHYVLNIENFHMRMLAYFIPTRLFILGIFFRPARLLDAARQLDTEEYKQLDMYPLRGFMSRRLARPTAAYQCYWPLILDLWPSV